MKYLFTNEDKQSLKNNAFVDVKWRQLIWTITQIDPDGTFYKVSVKGGAPDFMRERKFALDSSATTLQGVSDEMERIYSDWGERIKRAHDREIDRYVDDPTDIEGIERALKVYDTILGSHVYRTWC